MRKSGETGGIEGTCQGEGERVLVEPRIEHLLFAVDLLDCIYDHGGQAEAMLRRGIFLTLMHGAMASVSRVSVFKIDNVAIGRFLTIAHISGYLLLHDHVFTGRTHCEHDKDWAERYGADREILLLCPPPPENQNAYQWVQISSMVTPECHGDQPLQKAVNAGDVAFAKISQSGNSHERQKKFRPKN